MGEVPTGTRSLKMMDDRQLHRYEGFFTDIHHNQIERDLAVNVEITDSQAGDPAVGDFDAALQVEKTQA